MAYQQEPCQTLTKIRIDPRGRGMAPVSFIAFVREEPCLCDVYLPVVDPKTQAVRMQLICPKGEVFKASWWDRFARAGLRSVCVKCEDMGLLLDAMRQRAEALVADPSATKEEKAQLLQEMASLSVRAMFVASDRDPENTDKACDLAKRTVGMFLREEDVLHSLGRVLRCSSTVYDHSVNVCLMSLVLGRHLGMGKDRLRSLGVGALLHDVGISQIPTEIVDKPGELTRQEREEVEKHPRLGHQMLSLSKKVPYDALNVVLNHHEQPDGMGYPFGLIKENIPYLARLVRVVDVYDALTSPRPYRQAIPPSQAAVMLLDESEVSLDREIAVEFIRLHREAFR